MATEKNDAIKAIDAAYWIYQKLEPQEQAKTREWMRGIVMELEQKAGPETVLKERIDAAAESITFQGAKEWPGLIIRLIRYMEQSAKECHDDYTGVLMRVSWLLMKRCGEGRWSEKGASDGSKA